MLVMRSGSMSPDQPRAAVNIRKKAVLPETGSGGASGAFWATCLGASEQAENTIAAEIRVNSTRDLIECSGKQILVYRARIESEQGGSEA